MTPDITSARQFAVVTDSTADIAPEIALQRGIIESFSVPGV